VISCHIFQRKKALRFPYFLLAMRSHFLNFFLIQFIRIYQNMFQLRITDGQFEHHPVDAPFDLADGLLF